MALNTSPEMSGGVFSAIKDALGLFSNTNKYNSSGNEQNPTPIDEYESSLDEKEIMQLISQWEGTYEVYYKEIEKSQKKSFDYWIGKQKNEEETGNETSGTTDNILFEAIETFLPIATRANPEPLVTADPSDIGQEISKSIKVALTNWADEQKLRSKLAKTTRNWVLNRLGVVKVSWNPKIKTIELSTINPKRMIFDKDGYIDEGGCFVGEYLGEKKKASAEKLVDLFPKKKEQIMLKAGQKKGTKLEYREWWYRGTDVIFVLDNILLGKYKNPNWNYDIEGREAKEPLVAPDGMIIEDGYPAQEEVQGTNHLKEVCYPYRFLSIFSTGEQPHDNTSLILQNIPQQDKINRRERQIDKNVNGMNNGMIVSGTAFTESQASEAAAALRRGVAIRVPNGAVGDAVMFPQRPGLPNDVYASLKDARDELRNVFGTAGSTAQGVKSQESVRGKIMVNQMDSSRIGGGITEFIEQLADSIYNLVVQFMFVYYDEEHFVTTAGSVAGIELFTLKNDKFPLLKTLNITVKEGTLVPKDPLTQRNEAVDLWSQGAIDPLSLYKKLDFPDPSEATKQLILWQMLQKGQISPEQYLPSFAIQGQGGLGQPVGVGGPAVNNPTGGDVNSEQPTGTQPPVEQASQQLLGQIPI